MTLVDNGVKKYEPPYPSNEGDISEALFAKLTSFVGSIIYIPCIFVSNLRDFSYTDN